MAVTSDTDSTVGGSFPLTVSVTTNYAFPALGQITISSLTLSQATSGACAITVTLSSDIASHTCTYDVSTKVVTITATTLLGSATELANGKTISITLSDVQYNTSPTLEALTVQLFDGNKCLIERDTKSACWGPKHPAKITDAKLTVASGGSTQVGSIDVTFKLVFTTIVAIESTNLVYIALDPEVTSGTAKLSCLQLTPSLDQAPGSVVKGTMTLANNRPATFFFFPFIFPATEKPFKVTATCYTDSTASSVIQTGTSNTLVATRGRNIAI